MRTAAMAASLAPDVRPQHWAMFAAIMVAAILLRIVALDAYGLWTDEALTIVLSDWSIPDTFLLPTDPTPPLYYVIHKLLIPANAPLEVVRSISVAAGVTSVGLIYLLGRLAFGASGGLLAAALLAVWSAHVDYSQEARVQPAIFRDAFDKPWSPLLRACPAWGGRREQVGCPPPAIGPIFVRRRKRPQFLHSRHRGGVDHPDERAAARHRRARAAESSVRTLVRRRRHGDLCIAGIYRLIQQMLIGDEFHWLQQAGPVDFAATTASVFLPVGLWDNPLTRELGAIGIAQAAVAPASLALLGAGSWFGRRRLHTLLHERPVVLWLILAYLASPVDIWLFGFVARPLFMDRVILFSVPGMVLLITAVCLSLGERSAMRAAIAAVVLYGASTLLFGTMREKEDWRGAYRFLAAAASPNDVIAVCPFYNYPALRYHASAAVRSAVLAVRASGAVVEAEHGLGANPDWDKIYFRAALVPRMPGQPAAKMGVPTTLRLQPGQCGVSTDIAIPVSWPISRTHCTR